MLTWLKERWEIVLGVLVALAGLFSFLSRSRSSKNVLRAANKAQKQEAGINEKALDTLATGIEAIQEEKEENLKRSDSEHRKIQEAIDKEKEEFIKKSIDGDTLARDIADHLGATHVKSD